MNNLRQGMPIHHHGGRGGPRPGFRGRLDSGLENWNTTWDCANRCTIPKRCHACRTVRSDSARMSRRAGGGAWFGSCWPLRLQIVLQIRIESSSPPGRHIPTRPRWEAGRFFRRYVLRVDCRDACRIQRRLSRTPSPPEGCRDRWTNRGHHGPGPLGGTSLDWFP